MLEVHPGEVLQEGLEDYDLNAHKLSQAIGVPANRITEILNERRGITADTALRLSMFFDTTPQFWMNLQSNYDLPVAMKKKRPKIKKFKAA